jgi:hypothetical protein
MALGIGENPLQALFDGFRGLSTAQGALEFIRSNENTHGCIYAEIGRKGPENVTFVSKTQQIFDKRRFAV